MSDKTKPFESFQDFYVRTDFTMEGGTRSYERCWNAAVEATRQEMQAKIDKRDALLKCLLNRGNVYTYTNGRMEYVISEQFYNVVKSEFKELNQGNKDEQ